MNKLTDNHNIKMYDFRSDYISIVMILCKKTDVNYINRCIKLLQAVNHSDYKYVDDVIADEGLLPSVVIECCEHIAIFNGDRYMLDIFYDKNIWDYKATDEIKGYICSAVEGESVDMLKWLLSKYEMGYYINDLFNKYVKNGSVEILTILYDCIVRVSQRNITEILLNVYSKCFKYNKTKLLDHIIKNSIRTIHTVSFVLAKLCQSEGGGKDNIKTCNFISYVILKSKFDSFILFNRIFEWKFDNSISTVSMRHIAIEIYWEEIGKYLHLGNIQKDIITHTSNTFISRLLHI